VLKYLNYQNSKKIIMQFSEPLSNSNPQEAKKEVGNILQIDYHNLKKASLILRSLNHKLRQQILIIIDEEKKITVTEIYVKLRLEQSVASQHLAILRKAGIVTTQREGKFIYYTINNKRVEAIERFVKDLVG